MIRDDFDQVDIDAPIPYELTPKGRRDLAEALLEERFRHPHRWDFSSELQRFVCLVCGDERAPWEEDGIPSYLHRRDRK